MWDKTTKSCPISPRDKWCGGEVQWDTEINSEDACPQVGLRLGRNVTLFVVNKEVPQESTVWPI